MLKKYIVLYSSISIFLYSHVALSDYEIALVGFDDYDIDCNLVEEPLDYTWNCLNYLYSKASSWNFDRRTYPDPSISYIQHWEDSVRDAQGADEVLNYGVDTHDVGVIYGHGIAKCSSTDHRSVVNWMKKSSGGECNLDFGISTGEENYNDARWGDLDLNLLIFDACQSLQKCVLEYGGYNVWIAASSGTLSIINGYNGDNYDTYEHSKHFEDFVDVTQNNNFGHDWVHEMTDKFESQGDECAVSLVYEDSENDADTTYNYTGFKDWAIPNEHYTYWYYYIESCDPTGSGEL